MKQLETFNPSTDMPVIQRIADDPSTKEVVQKMEAVIKVAFGNDGSMSKKFTNDFHAALLSMGFGRDGNLNDQDLHACAALCTLGYMIASSQIYHEQIQEMERTGERPTWLDGADKSLN